MNLFFLTWFTALFFDRIYKIYRFCFGLLKNMECGRMARKTFHVT